jgi:hypothetical protein
MRRLPGPACCRLSEGDSPPEALYELFRDWQRIQTQSSVKALRSPRLQMDVWFCRAQEPMPRGTLLRVEHPELLICTLSRACPGHPCLHLTNDYMDVGYSATITSRCHRRSSSKARFPSQKHLLQWAPFKFNGWRIENLFSAVHSQKQSGPTPTSTRGKSHDVFRRSAPATR